MVPMKMFDEDTLIDWQREAREEMKTLRFCPNCGQLITLKFKEHKYYQNFYSCPRCGDTILSKGIIRNYYTQGYSRFRTRSDSKV